MLTIKYLKEKKKKYGFTSLVLLLYFLPTYVAPRSPLVCKTISWIPPPSSFRNHSQTGSVSKNILYLQEYKLWLNSSHRCQEWSMRACLLFWSLSTTWSQLQVTHRASRPWNARAILVTKQLRWSSVRCYRLFNAFFPVVGQCPVTFQLVTHLPQPPIPLTCSSSLPLPSSPPLFALCPFELLLHHQQIHLCP